MPVVAAQRKYVRSGNLATHGARLSESHRRATTYGNRIGLSKRGKTGDLPVEQPTKFGLVINRQASGRSDTLSRARRDVTRNLPRPGRASG